MAVEAHAIVSVVVKASMVSSNITTRLHARVNQLIVPFTDLELIMFGFIFGTIKSDNCHVPHFLNLNPKA